MKGRKGSTDEGGVRVPCLVRWKGKIAAGSRISQMGAAIDLLPTLASMAGVPLRGTQPLDGINLEPLLRGKSNNWPDRTLVSHWRGRVSVRTQGYVLDHTGQLFDLDADPGQRRNVAGDHPELVARLRAVASEYKAELLPGLEDDDRPFPVGYPEFPVTHLPARDGVPHGGVQRSARAPNCSYFTNWTSTSDRITWDVDVETAGTYDVVVYYTCPRESLGTTVELSLGESRLQQKVTEPHDPPLVGQAEDRVSRGNESYVKDFKPMEFGALSLKKGRGQLTLRATQIPGTMAMDVRYVVLTLVP